MAPGTYVESIDFIGQTADERSYVDRQRQPGDFEAQVSQRPIAIHALENRATSDTGVARLRRLLRQNIRALAAGDAISQPDSFGLDALPTYCQDTVCRWHGSDPPDTEAMRAQGRRVARTVLESAHLPPRAREAYVREKCEHSAGDPASNNSG